jgi:hypothetical protein
VQAERIAFSSALEAFALSNKMITSDGIAADHPLALHEVAAQIDPDGKFEIKEFGRWVKVQSIDKSKEVDLSLRDDGGNIFISVVISKVRSEHEQRNIAKYLENAKNKATAKMKGFGFQKIKGEIGLSRLDIYAQWFPKPEISLTEIERLANVILEARAAMELE